MCQKLVLKLYISGDTLRSRKAVSNLQAFCDRDLTQPKSIEIIDVIEFPEIAEAKKILITPTLIREFPLPEERVIGDLSDSEILSFALNISSQINSKK